MTDARTVGENIAFHRKRLGLSQVEFAAEIGRSESWVSQVERGVRDIDRMSVLQAVATALGISVTELKGEPEANKSPEERPEAFEMLRLALTGHPAPKAAIARWSGQTIVPRVEILREKQATIWPMVHGGRYAELAPVLAELITDLEINIRQEISEEDALEARRLLADAYQAAAAALAKIGDGDAAWIAADRAAFVSESIGSPLALSASLFRMAHVFLGLGMISQVQKVATGAMSALGDLIIMPSDTIRIKDNADIEAVSLYGAFNLILAVAAAHENQRSEARSHLDTARAVASYVGDGRNDFGTEFGPTNVALHAVSVAVELGDAGEALDLSRQVNTATLSPERQARYLIDLAAAYSMRRQIGDAIRCLTEADKLTPEQTRTHRVARDVTRELLQLSGVRVRPELRDLADRFGLT